MTQEHSDDCECGCHEGSGPELYPPYAALGIVGFILVAISMLISGMGYILAFMQGDIMWNPSFNTVCIYVFFITAICLFVLSAYGLYRGVYAESLFFVIYGVFTIVLACTQQETIISPETMRMVNVLFGILFLIPVLVFILSKEGLLTIGVLTFVVTLFACEIAESISGDIGLFILGIGSIICGAIFAYIATANLLYAESGKNMPLF